MDTMNTMAEEGHEYEDIQLYHKTTAKSADFDITSCPAYSSTIGQPTPQDYTEAEYEAVDVVQLP